MIDQPMVYNLEGYCDPRLINLQMKLDAANNKIAELEEVNELLFDCCHEVDAYSQLEYNANYIKAKALKENNND